ncbi:MAG: 3-keto-5-aminohexanoate cleavage protein [Acidobacteria bacterium]|nr:MAG: 3-keto-5-aminohexanoate cleavage protein [Acidobacteriota bacterium]REJ99082.1 MAG: 3-keto-5-aminohexanoate cleavage protein [Acidobacteriota bacterium]REK16198.1 MAG: 3-keto-5-aminohexanoate cleavage protein [Acidobacteriota bacterium]REK43879.1 MAG: 3-keto-5-aminohexanoate cleavage protein [Acidobacteriota bacterium]
MKYDKHDVAINLAPTGMIPTKEMTPHVPVSPEEVIEDVHECYELGITMAHIHARDEDGVPTYKPEIYARMIEGIRKYAPDLIICVSLSGRNFKEFEKRSAPLELDGSLKPDMGSLTLSSLNFNKEASMNSPEMIQQLAAHMKARGIKPELEAFDAGMANYAKYLIQKGIVTPPYYCNVLLGNIACAQADMMHAGIIINDLPEETYWSLAGIGNAQLPMNSMSIATGGGVRVGIEDNIWYDSERTKLARNADLVKRIHVIASANGREIMKPSKMREILCLNAGNGEYGFATEKTLETVA